MLCAAFLALGAEPIVMLGSDLPEFLGARIADLRILNLQGTAIPFQVDEIADDGDYVLPSGTQPNADQGNGVLDSLDEIVFLWDDASPLNARSGVPGSAEGTTVVTLRRGVEQRAVVVVTNGSLPLSSVRYITYDHVRQKIVTPHYYADFGKDRFHFVGAGIGREDGGYVDIARELRVLIYVRALFGLIPITYDEESLVSIVKRYKTGPVRLIRRGDFHLRLGLWFKGSRAAVHQVCYPGMVSVPVSIHLPVSFKRVSREAYIEMTPVIGSSGRSFRFDVPGHEISLAIGDSDPIDTLVPLIPSRYMAVHDNRYGYGWLLRTSMPDTLIDGSGYRLCRPSERGGSAHCGFRLTVRDLPRGQYRIENFVFFSRQGLAGLDRMNRMLISPARVSAGRKEFPNRLTQPRKRLNH